MNPPAISVVLPVRNGQRTLPTAIQSILDQTLRDWELIAVDDGSSDDTTEILQHSTSIDARIRYAQANGQGIVAALNQGLALARSGLIARMDADDVSHPDRLRQQLEHLQSHPEIGLVSCLVGFGGDRTRSEGYALHVDWLNSVLLPDEIALNRFVESPLAHPSVLFRRDLLDRHGGYLNGPFPEDYELWLRWLDTGVRMAKVGTRLMTWNDPVERLSRTDPRYITEAFFEIKANYLAKELHRALNGRLLWIWGAGRTTRKRAELLCTHGLEIAGYIDVDPAKTGNCVQGRPVVNPNDIPAPDKVMVVGYVASRGARDLIRASLLDRGFAEGRDFWMAA